MRSTLVLVALAIIAQPLSASVTTVSVLFNKTSNAYSTIFGSFKPGAAAFGRFENSANATGWATLDIEANGRDESHVYAAGVAEGVLTCRFVAAVSKNNGDIQANAAIVNFTKATIDWTRSQVVAHGLQDDFWRVVGRIIAQFDGLVDGYSRSECNASVPLSSLDLWLMQMDGDLEDLSVKFAEAAQGGRERGREPQ